MSEKPSIKSPAQGRLNLQRFQFKEDYRARLPIYISRFLGYRAHGSSPFFAPLPFPPFSWLERIPLRLEVMLFGWVGAFTSILLIEAIMSTHTAFRDVYDAPLIITSFGASAVLLFGVVESPLSQPRNLVLGHFTSALVGVCITRLWVRDGAYQGELNNKQFAGNTFVNGGLSAATALLAMLALGDVHPPAGATGLNAAVLPEVVAMSWSYIPTVLASALIMLSCALVINNLGRRRYPVYWWSAESQWVAMASPQAEELKEEDELARIEEGQSLSSAETRMGDVAGYPMQEVFEEMEGWGGS